jgi:hypothetical protein
MLAERTRKRPSLATRLGVVNVGGSMKTGKTMAAWVVVGFCLAATVVQAAADEKTITGVISGVNPTTRIATVTPASGPPLVVQFAFNVGGPCNTCLGSGRSGPTFAETITNGSTWTLTYTTSIPAGAATWFPGGTVNTVQKAVPVNDK